MIRIDYQQLARAVTASPEWRSALRESLLAASEVLDEELAKLTPQQIEQLKDHYRASA